MKPLRSDITLFKNNLVQLLNDCNESESEEFHKTLLNKFLDTTYYSGKHFINTKGRNDLVIHNGKDAKSPVAVIIETKKPKNKTEMPQPGNLNAKAMQELVLYYLRERISANNLELKQLIATDIFEWYVFDAQLFEKLFASDKKLVQLFNDFESGRLGGNKTDFFYREVAQPAIEAVKENVAFTYFNISDYEKPLRNTEISDDNKLIALQKIFSPEHLLKKPFSNDSNSLNKAFYNELLHIIGLTEIKDGSKKIITRKKEQDRDAGSLLENAIAQIDNLDILSYIPNPSRFGDSNDERMFNLGLELCITWINRILFLKLLEAQMLSYHKGNAEFRFLSIDKIGSFDELNQLFFSVLAKLPDERNARVKARFAKVPYLNSSLFETSEIEQQSVFISNLSDEVTLPLIANSVLKRNDRYSKAKEINTLEYLFEFLDAYDFSSDGSGEIQEDNKNLINASVLGLIFEKINGYRDGSFFTPGFITMYMCHETIRRAVVQKFNETKGWNCNTLDDLYNKIDDTAEANRIVNSIKICDPAVGSGHFLVSALNELISVKSDLRILCDRDGRRLKEYNVEIQNDELILTDEDGDIFEYKPGNKESQRVQEALFHEKQTLIENCLFGVDINPNSVKICRLRLWIELLKSAYYKAGSADELETLPNIDINIKCGNSLISRYALDADIKQALNQSSKWTIDGYRIAVDTYRNAKSKEQKREMERLISDIKSEFSSKIESPFTKKISDVRGKVDNLSEKILNLKTFGANIDKKLLNEHKAAVSKLSQLETEREEILNNKIFEKAFEWRFEFPEVLNDDGDFVGFDVVIGNPPYILVQSLGDKNIFNYYHYHYKTATYKIDTYALFYELGIKLLADKSALCFISPNTFLKNKHSTELRQLILSNTLFEIVNFYTQVFEDASVDTLILLLIKNKNVDYSHKFSFAAYRNNVFDLFEIDKVFHLQNSFLKDNYELILDTNNDIRKLLAKIEDGSKPLKDYGRSYFGIQTFDRNKYVSKTKLNVDYYPVIDGGNVKRYRFDQHTEFVHFKKESIKSGGDPSVYNRNRIVVRQIGVFPEGTIVEPDLMTLNTIYNIYLHDDNIDTLRFILALLNSKMFQYYWQKKHYDNKATFPKIKKEPLESLPIKIPNTEIIQIFSDLVKQILEQKSQNPSRPTIELESQIDKLVHQLYDLTEEEIKIIENA